MGKPPEMIISYTWLEIGIFKLQQMSHCKPSCCEICEVQHSGQIIIFHQSRFPRNKGMFLTKPPFGVRSCEVAII